MENHPIQSLMSTTLENLQAMVDVNTILGEPVETPDGSMIMPISRVGFGFAAGGSEFSGQDNRRNYTGQGASNSSTRDSSSFPFGGGAGGGVSISPMGFLVVGHGQVKVLSAVPGNQFYDRLIDMAPTIMEKIEELTKKKEVVRSDLH